MAYNSRKKNRYASSYDEVLSFLKKQGYEVRGGRDLDEAAIKAKSEETREHGRRVYTRKATNKAELALHDAIHKSVTKLISSIPDSTALPLLLWISHQYSLERIKNHEPTDSEPGWLNFRYERGKYGTIKLAPMHCNTREETKRLLIDCFDTSPSLFISNVSVLSRSFQSALNRRSNYSSHLRLKNFISHHFPDPADTEEYATTYNLIEVYKRLYSTESIPSQKGHFIITLLSAAHANPEWQPDSFLEKWPALLKHDADALGKTGNNKLFQAATEALGKPFSTRSDVAMEIDQLTEHNYTDLTIRNKYYRRIKYHIKKHSPKNKTEAVNRSFTVTKEFSQQTQDKPELKSEENIRLAIEETLEKFDEVKKIIASHNLSAANRSTPSRLSSRLTQATLNELDVLAKKLKGLNGLPARKNRSVALEIAVLFKERADLTRRKDTYPSYKRLNDAFTHPMQVRKGASLPAPAATTEIPTANQTPAEKPPTELNSNADQKKELAEPHQKDNPTPGIDDPAAHENEVEPEGGAIPEEFDDQDSGPSETDAKHQPTHNPAEQPTDEIAVRPQPSQAEDSLESPLGAAAATAAEEHEGSGVQPNTGEEDHTTSTSQTNIQPKQHKEAEQQSTDPNVQLQKAGTTPSDDAPKETQENKVETKTAAATPEGAQDTELPEARKASQENGISILRTPDGKEIRVRRKPPKNRL